MDDANPQHRILTATAAILATGGIAAATTRNVALAAGVQAPTIYRFFGDKDGLMLAVAEKVLDDYARDKTLQPPRADPVADLRQGWDAHVAFALQHPDIFRIILGREGASPALQRGSAVLQAKIAAVARAGRLRMPLGLAADLFHALATGVILRYLRQTQAARDPALSDLARDAAMAALTGEAETQVASGSAGAAQALRQCLPEIARLSDGEKLLLAELLDRIAQAR